MSRRSLVVLLLAVALLAPQPLPPREQPARAANETVVGELVDLRTEHSSTVRNDDGTLTTTVSAGPLHFDDGSGEWEPISLDVAPAVGRRGFAWENVTNTFEARFAGELEGPGEPIHELSVEDLVFEVAADVPPARGDVPEVPLEPVPVPSDESSSTPPDDGTAGGLLADPLIGAPVGELAGAAAAPAAGVGASVRGSTVRYPEAWPGVDLSYDVLPSGIKETLELEGPTSTSRFRFVIAAPDGVRVEENEGGSWSVLDPTGEYPLFVLAEPWAADADELRDGDAAPLDIIEGDSRVAMTVSQNDSEIVVDLAVDPLWLASPLTAFPVTVDPTILVRPSDQDAYFKTSCPTCAAYLNDRLNIGTSNTNIYQTAVQFPLDEIPAGATVTSAELGLWYDEHRISCSLSTCAQNMILDLHRMTGPWSTASVSQDLQFEGTAAATYTLSGGLRITS